MPMSVRQTIWPVTGRAPGGRGSWSEQRPQSARSPMPHAGIHAFRQNELVLRLSVAGVRFVSKNYSGEFRLPDLSCELRVTSCRMAARAHVQFSFHVHSTGTRAKCSTKNQYISVKCCSQVANRAGTGAGCRVGDPGIPQHGTSARFLAALRMTGFPPRENARRSSPRSAGRLRRLSRAPCRWRARLHPWCRPPRGWSRAGRWGTG